MSAGDEIQLVTFRIGDQEFGFNVYDVERILRYETPVSLPEAPDYLEGTLQYGDDVVPIVDLRKRLEVPAPIREETRVVVVELEKGRAGMVVDAVLEVMKVSADRVKKPSPLVKGLAAKYIAGIVSVAERTLVMLAVSKLLSSTEKVALEVLTAELTHE